MSDAAKIEKLKAVFLHLEALRALRFSSFPADAVTAAVKSVAEGCAVASIVELAGESERDPGWYKDGVLWQQVLQDLGLKPFASPGDAIWSMVLPEAQAIAGRYFSRALTWGRASLLLEQLGEQWLRPPFLDPFRGLASAAVHLEEKPEPDAEFAAATEREASDQFRILLQLKPVEVGSQPDRALYHPQNYQD
jgi:hypothetical protein